jgi:hypothetical protein
VDLGVDGRIMLKWLLRQIEYFWDWTEFNSIKVGDEI